MICEVLRSISAFRSRFSLRGGAPGIDWKAIAGMRNVLVHNDFDVDFEAIWNVAVRDLAPLETVMRSIPGRMKAGD